MADAGCRNPPPPRPVSSTADRGSGAAPQRTLFPPEQLTMLEGPDRDEWQQPQHIMDMLSIADGSHVADLGAGGGWFTVRLAQQVGPNGLVYAEDIQPAMIESIKRRITSEGISNVRLVLGTPDDPQLPEPVQAALLVDLYSQLSEPVTLLKNVRASLTPNGRLGIVDFKKTEGFGPGPAPELRVKPEVIVRDAERAGLRLIKRDDALRYQYLLVFGK